MDTLTHTEQVQGLFVQHISQIRVFIVGMAPNFSIAEDLLQEVFITVTRRADDFKMGTNFMGWVYCIARLKVKEFARQQNHLPWLLSEEAMDALADTTPVDNSGWEKQQRALAECMQKLAPKARKIMELRYAEGFLPQEIAQALLWSLNAVNVQLSRVRSFLRACTQRKMILEDI